MADDTVRVEVDSAEFKALMASIKQFDPNLAKALRKRLRQIGSDIVVAMRAEILKPPPTGGRSKGSHHSRQQTAAGLKVQVATAAKKQGVFVAGSSSKMAGGRQAFPRMYNKKAFRHPVFARGGRNARWVNQQGNPYFGSVIARFESRAQEDITAALQEAVDAIKGAS